MKKKVLAVLLSASLALSMMPGMALAAEDGFSDTQGHWGESAIQRWADYGVVNGYNDGSFQPNDSMKRSEVAALFVKLLGLEKTADLSSYGDVSTGDWYYEAISKCVAAGILNGVGNDSMNPNGTVTREQLFTMFARALGVAPKDSAEKTFVDGAEVSDWAAGYVNALADMGVVGGVGEGKLAPEANINRASVMTVLDKAITTYVNTDGAVVSGSADDKGITLVVADNVTVTGTVDTLVVADSNSTVTVSGTVASVKVMAQEAEVVLTETAKVEEVSISAAAQGAELVVNEGAAVTNVTSEADGVSISGSGTVENAAISGDDTKVETEGTKVDVAAGTTGTTAGGQTVEGGSSVETPATNTTSTPSSSATVVPVLTWRSVTFKNGDETVYTTSVVNGYTVTAPGADATNYPTVGNGEKVTWYKGGEPFDFDTPITSDITLTAVVGSNKFDAGNGSKEYPYLISTAGELAQIIPGTTEKSLNYRLIADIDLKDSTEAYGAYVLENVNLDGNGKTISSSVTKQAYGVFDYAQGKVTISNLTYDLTNVDFLNAPEDCAGLIYEATATSLLLENVKVIGTHSVNSNNAPFVFREFMPAGATLTFKNCEYAADMQGNGYNACFIGWQGANVTINGTTSACTANITFENCSVTGTMVCPQAAVFAANGSYAFARSYTFTDNTITGTVRGTTAAYFVTAVNPQPDSDAEKNAKESFNLAAEDNTHLYKGQTDAMLNITADNGDALVITKSDSDTVKKYEVQVGLYTTLYKDGEYCGTWLYFVTQTINASEFTGDTVTAALRNTGFVDESYCTASKIEISTDELGNRIATIDGKTYYVVADYVDNEGNQGYVGTPTAGAYRDAQVIRVISYAGDTMYSSARLK